MVTTIETYIYKSEKLNKITSN